MSNFQRLLKQCELLKMRIKELESLETPEDQMGIRAIQFEVLRKQLTKVGRQLKNLSLYKENEND